MTRWAHRLAGRSLDERRPHAFAAVAAVLVLAAGVLALVERDGRAPVDGVASDRARPAIVAPPLVEEANAAAAEDLRGAVVGQARRFLAGYLRYLYGQGSARAIRGSSDALRRRLVSARLRVPPAARRRQPRVVRVVAEPLDDGRWHVVATVADGGVARYPVELLITAGAGAVRVVEVSSE